MKEHIKNAALSMKQKAKIAASKTENKFRDYFNPKGADIYARFVRKIIFALFLSGILAVIVISISLLIARIGAPLTKVPKVTGMDVVSAMLRLQDRKLLVSVDSKFDDTVDKFTVVDQFPKKGLTVREGRTVKLIVSLGKDTYTVPNITGKSREEAEKILKAQNIPYEITVIQTEDFPTNTIINQSLAPNKQVPRTVKLHLTANSDVGKNDYRMPDFRSQSLEYAINTLYQNNVIPRIEKSIVNSVDKDGIVIDQSADPDSVIPKNSTVDLKVGVYGEDDIERAKYDYHIYRFYVKKPADTPDDSQEADVSVSVKDELGEDKTIFNQKLPYNKWKTIVFKSLGATTLGLVINGQYVEEKNYE